MWRAVRTPALIVLLVCAAGIVLALARSAGGPPLDPRSADPAGGRALARLLDRQGVTVEPTYTSAGLRPAGATLLVTDPDLVDPATLSRLAGQAAHVVLVEPGDEALTAVAPAVSRENGLAVTTREPGCALAAATAAGPVTIGGTGYQARRTCYDGAIAQSGRVTVVGGPQAFGNDALGEQGNAALALRLLGERQRLVWYVPSAGDPGLAGGQESLYDLLPGAWVFGAVQAGVAVVLLALWRARRLGPVVTEPLPVVVRAAETVEGRARLYRRAGATGHAADALRRASLGRLRGRLGLGADAGPQTVLAAIAARTGRDVGPLLYGPPPEGDAALVRLADALDALENEVRQ